jgi:hypothetical protein
LNDWVPDPSDPARYDKRLAIVVPYRDRAEHRDAFVPHLLNYFRYDKLDRRIAMSLHLVEQAGTGIFNRGKLKNVGYALTGVNHDYVCFHDVDYLPIWADYSWSPRPARLIWNGLRYSENRETFLAAVVLFDNPSFERINGYPNTYWGYGFEDAEIGLRCDVAGVAWERRDGTFRGLAHPHAGMDAHGALTAEALATQRQFHERRPNLRALMAADGLSDLRFVRLASSRLRVDGREIPNAFHHIVDIGGP